MVLKKIFVFCLFAMGIQVTVFAGSANSASIKKANENGVNDKLFDLFRTANRMSKTSKNLVLSPYSILTATAMLERGTDGESKKQLDKAFGIDKLPKEYFSQYLNDRNFKAILKIANGIWINNRFRIAKSYQNILKNEFYSYATNVDFQKNPANTARKINSFVSRHTNGFIRNVVDSDDILRAAIFLLNTVYFNGEWDVPFDGNLTQRDIFYPNEKRKIKVNMMTNINKLLFFRAKTVSGVELLYKGGRFSMLVLLPNKQGNAELNKVIENLSQKNISMWIKSLKGKKLKFIMPKSKIHFRANLNNIFKKLGVTDVFSPSRADFSKAMAEEESSSAFVSRILHETIVTVDELATIAVSMTYDECDFGEEPPPPPSELTFVINRPYLFIIRDRVTENILFIGKITNP